MLRSALKASAPDHPTAPFKVGSVEPNIRKSICKRVSSKHDISYDKADGILTDLILFLSTAAAFDDALFSPPDVIDHVWHEFILHTHAYTEFCHYLGVFYIHHVPCDENGDGVELPEGRDVREILFEYGLSYDKSLWENFKAACYGCDSEIQRWSRDMLPSSVIQ